MSSALEWRSAGNGVSRRRGRRNRRAPLLLLLAAWMVAGALVTRSCVAKEPGRPPGVVTASGGSSITSTSAASRPEHPIAHTDTALLALIQRLVDEENGETAVSIRHLRTGATAGYHEQEVYPAASLAKIPILVEVYRQLDAGMLQPSEVVTISPDLITDGAGVLQARAREQLPISELLRLTVAVSDNVAARALLQRVGGVEAVNRTMASLGLRHTRLYTDDRPNTLTAAEMASLMAWVAARGGAPGMSVAPASPLPNSLASLLTLPQGQAWIKGRLPPAVPVAHKSGQLPSLRHEAAIVYGPPGPFVVVGLTQKLADQNDAEAFLARLAAEAYAYFGRQE
jgi:beta-lactamase class A